MVLMALQLLDNEDDRQFIGNIYMHHRRLLYATARKYCSNENDHDDIIQESFLRLIKKIDTLRMLESSAQTAYVVATVRNTSISHMRKEAHRIKLSSQDDLTEADGRTSNHASVEEQVIIMGRMDCLASIWAHLSEHDRILLESKYLLGYTNNEIAELFQCKASSIRMKLTRARQHALDLLREKEQVITI